MEAAKRGIENGDIVKVYNERGEVLCGAYITERIMPGIIYVDHGARTDEIIPTVLDRGGNIQAICPKDGLSKYCTGLVGSGYLVEYEKVTLDQMDTWKKEYPDAFARAYDPASGLHFDAWVEGGM